MDPLALRHLCLLCFATLDGDLRNTPIDISSLRPSLTGSFPLFVTWNANQRLRGCIGNFGPQHLETGLQEYARASAFRDSRFRAIRLAEMPSLSCAVSLLVNFEDAQDYTDYTIGTHGIWIEFTSQAGRKQTATYLPEVASSQGWNHVECIDSLLRKGGWSVEITEEIRRAVKVTRYQSMKHSVEFGEYE
ncbi:hypothetical protein HDU98_002040, partial [Podochytrium sp. JEL0797]